MNDNKSSNREKRKNMDESSEQKFVDDIPLEDLKIDLKDEKKKKKTKNDSESERKYKKNNDK